MNKVDERARIEVDYPVETEDACSFSSDISDVSLDFESVYFLSFCFCILLAHAMYHG